MAIILPSLNFNSIILSVLFTLLIFTTTTTNGALVQKDITLNLIHRDSLLSPLYNPSLNKTDRIRNLFQRSISRANRFRPKSSVSLKHVEPTVYYAHGEYVIGLSFGTPPMSQIGIIDTGSDVIWTQCQPCVNCYEQSTPIFDPRKSSTYKALPCSSKECEYLAFRRSCSKNNICGYSITYGDSSSTMGDVATETLTFESGNRDKASLPNVIIGCGYDNVGTFGEQKISSLVGLGGGALSLASQLGSSTGGKFSYCLIPFSSEERKNFTSKLYFGTKGEVSGRGVVSTPIIRSSMDTLYLLTLEGISVGNEKIPFYNPKKSSTSSFDDYGTPDEGNIILDSGTTLTLLPPDLYARISTALKRAIQGKQVQDPTGQLELCYEARRDLKIPNVIAHFTGADLVLNQVNTFVDASKGVVCLAMIESNQAIWGNIAQINFLVGYDTKEWKVSFKPTDCTKEV